MQYIQVEQPTTPRLSQRGLRLKSSGMRRANASMPTRCGVANAPSERRHNLGGIAAALVAGMGAVVGSAHAGWTVIKLHPNHPGAISSFAEATRGGKQAGKVWYQGDESAGWVATRWAGTAASASALFSNGGSIAQGVDGVQYVGYQFLPGQRAMLWTNNGVGPANAVNLHPLGAGMSEISAIDGGLKVGGVDDKAALWTATNTWINLHPTGFMGSEALGVHGQIKVGMAYMSGPVSHAMLWDAANNAIDLSPPGSLNSILCACYGTQQVGRVEFPASPLRAYLWNGTPNGISLHPANMYASAALAAGNGAQAGWVQAALNGPYAAAIWFGTPNSYVNLGAMVPGFSDTFATGVEKIGQQIWVSGWGVNTLANNRVEALLWYYTKTIPLNPVARAVPATSGNELPE
ncbi:MAG: hypothetical protein ACKVW3_02855 [Phycisphaerales bacterium]